MSASSEASKRDRTERCDSVRLALAGLLAAAGGLHLAALPSHRHSSFVAGAFFASTAVMQLLGAVLIATRPSRRTILAVVAGNLVVLGIWGLSRTAGLPIGGELGKREPLALLDGLATVVEMLVVAGGLRAAVYSPTSAGRSSGWRDALVLVGVWMTISGVANGLSDGGHHHHATAAAHHAEQGGDDCLPHACAPDHHHND